MQDGLIRNDHHMMRGNASSIPFAMFEQFGESFDDCRLAVVYRRHFQKLTADQLQSQIGGEHAPWSDDPIPGANRIGRYRRNVPER
jgi:hypothetical protein